MLDQQTPSENTNFNIAGSSLNGLSESPTKSEPDMLETLLSDKKNHTENGLAAAFVQTCGHNIQFVEDWNRWVVWDETRFRRDPQECAVLGMASEFAKALWRPFQAYAMRVEPAEAGAALRFVKKANSKSCMSNFIRLAAPKLCISSKDLNQNLNLINLRNGTFNLQTMKFREHSRDDLITEIANVSYESKATHRATRVVSRSRREQLARAFVQGGREKLPSGNADTLVQSDRKWHGGRWRCLQC